MVRHTIFYTRTDNATNNVYRQSVETVIGVVFGRGAYRLSEKNVRINIRQSVETVFFTVSPQRKVLYYKAGINNIV